MYLFPFLPLATAGRASPPHPRGRGLPEQLLCCTSCSKLPTDPNKLIAEIEGIVKCPDFLVLCCTPRLLIGVKGINAFSQP